MDKNINTFVDLVIEQKKLQFSENETDFDRLLFKKNVVKSEDGKISIIDYKVVSNVFLNKYKEIFNFKVEEYFYSNTEFLNKVKDDFLVDGYVQNFNILEEEIWKLIIKESITEHKCSFNEYLKSINTRNKPEHIFKFIKAYSDTLSELDLDRTA